MVRTVLERRILNGSTRCRLRQTADRATGSATPEIVGPGVLAVFRRRQRGYRNAPSQKLKRGDGIDLRKSSSTALYTTAAAYRLFGGRIDSKRELQPKLDLPRIAPRQSPGDFAEARVAQHRDGRTQNRMVQDVEEVPLNAKLHPLAKRNLAHCDGSPRTDPSHSPDFPNASRPPLWAARTAS